MPLPPAPNAILTRDEVAAWLKVKPRQVERLGVPCLDLGRKTKRYVVKDLLEWLQAKRLEAERPQQMLRDREALRLQEPVLDSGTRRRASPDVASGERSMRVAR